MTRRTLLAGIAGVVFSGSAAAARGTRGRRASFEQTQTELELPGLDPAHDGLRIAQLSDLHVGLATPAERILAAVDAVNASGADLVALTGDYVTNSAGPVPLVSELLEGLTLPAFAVLGNHDHWVDAKGLSRQLEQVGCAVLHNEHTSFRVRGAKLCVVGVDDERSGHDDVAAAFRGAPKSGSRLVLAHTPTSADKLPAHAGLLCLSGHTHGGQWMVPGVTERVMQHAGHKYVRGLFRVNGNSLYVNRGLGFGIGGPAVRLGSKPEVSYFTLRRAPERKKPRR